ncbi:MAG: hypothetical protein HY960_10395 [Ignavibacteriae bacterium]|nr:hypothetical protein [Ignavibacteriota bacterium]
MLTTLPPDAKVFKYKLDFYYVQTIFYLVALVLWAGFRGTFSLPKLPPMQADPILYIILTFVVVSLLTVLLNKLRERRLIVLQDRMVFHRKSHEREVLFSDIEWMYIGRERRVQTAGRFQVVLFKLKDRLRLIRIRIGRYEHEDELLIEMERIAEIVPKMKRPMQMLRAPRIAQQLFS